jgi:eukaryotic-like serine/threonine-protein kinase
MLARGQILSGKYRLENEIGRGGMGSVWRSTRLDLGTSLALKVMHGLASDNPSGFERLSREAKSAASLSSPHVVRVIDFGVDTASNTTFIAMELLEGESLAQRLERGVPLSLHAVAKVITQVARALSQAHAAGIIHRDLKPANVFLVQNGDDELVKLLDFGVAKAGGSLGAGLATATGHVLGTPYYMSPEQVNSLKDIDHRTDIWSLGVIASECLTRRRPFMAETLSELAMKISLGRAETPSSVAPVPAGFDAWFARATAVEPARRFQSVTQLAAELQALAAKERGGPKSASSSFAFATTQRAESPGDLGSPATGRLEVTAASERWGPVEVALSTTAHGGALSARVPESRRSKSWSAPVLGGIALIVVLGLGGALSGVFRRSDELPRPASRAQESPSPVADPVVARPAVTDPVVTPFAASPSAASPLVAPITASSSAASPLVAPIKAASDAPAHVLPSASKATPRKTAAERSMRPAAIKPAKAAPRPSRERLDAYDIP